MMFSFPRGPSPVLLMLMFFVPVDSVLSQDSEPEIRPEMQPLTHYLGTWDSEFQIVNQRDNQTPKIYRGTVKAEWTVGGGFLEQTGVNTLDMGSKPFEFKTLMGFDKQTGDFEFHYFYSSGDAYRSRATWDEEKKIMTSVRQDQAGQTVRIVADFSEPDTEHWTILVLDIQGRTKMEIKGTNRRRKSE